MTGWIDAQHLASAAARARGQNRPLRISDALFRARLLREAASDLEGILERQEDSVRHGDRGDLCDFDARAADTLFDAADRAVEALTEEVG